MNEDKNFNLKDVCTHFMSRAAWAAEILAVDVLLLILVPRGNEDAGPQAWTSL